MIRAAGMMASTPGAGTAGSVATPSDPAKIAHDHRPATMPGGGPASRATAVSARLLQHQAEHLSVEHAERFEHGEVAAAADAGEQHVGERGDSQEGQGHREDERGVTDACVVQAVPNLVAAAL